MSMSVAIANYFLQVEYDNLNHLTLSDTDKQDLNNDSTSLRYVLRLSRAGSEVLERVIYPIEIDWSTPSSDSIIMLVNSTDLKTRHPGVYKLINACLLEVYTCDYILEDDASYMQYLQSSDIALVRQNIRYLCDWLAQYRAYRFLVEYFRGLEVGLGYLENQITLILNSTDLSKSFNHLTY